MDYKLLGKQFGLEVLRVAVLAVIPVALTYLEILSPEIATAIVVVLKGIDRSTYKANILKRGIVQF